MLDTSEESGTRVLRFSGVLDAPAAARDWAAAQAQLSARARAGKAVNLDPAALVMDMLIELAHLPPARSALPAKG